MRDRKQVAKDIVDAVASVAGIHDAIEEAKRERAEIRVVLQQWNSEGRCLRVRNVAQKPVFGVTVSQYLGMDDQIPEVPSISWASYGSVPHGDVAVFAEVLSGAMEVAAYMELSDDWERFVLPEGYDWLVQGCPVVRLVGTMPEFVGPSKILRPIG
jgi:hypothetical protein